MLDQSTVASTAYVDGFLTVQIETLGDDSSCAPAETTHAFGFFGRPKDPDVNTEGNITNGCRVEHWYEGSTLHTKLRDDPRRTVRLPTIDKGGSIMYADCDGAYIKYSADGSLEIFVPDGKLIKAGGSDAAALAHSQQTLDIVTQILIVFDQLALYIDSIQGIADPMPPHTATTTLKNLIFNTKALINTTLVPFVPTTKLRGT